MAKKAKPAPVANADDLTDEEIAAAEAEAIAADVEVVTVVQPVAVVEAKPAVAFITSFNQTSLAEANRVAREELAAENALVVEAHAAALEAVTKVLNGRGDPTAVLASFMQKPR